MATSTATGGGGDSVGHGHPYDAGIRPSPLPHKGLALPEERGARSEERAVLVAGDLRISREDSAACSPQEGAGLGGMAQAAQNSSFRWSPSRGGQTGWERHGLF